MHLTPAAVTLGKQVNEIAHALTLGFAQDTQRRLPVARVLLYSTQCKVKTCKFFFIHFRYQARLCIICLPGLAVKNEQWGFPLITRLQSTLLEIQEA